MPNWERRRNLRGHLPPQPARPPAAAWVWVASHFVQQRNNARADTSYVRFGPPIPIHDTGTMQP
jgi:hypothetical protein